MIRALMKKIKKKKWSIGLQFLQFQNNLSLHRIIERSLYKALFGCESKIGIFLLNLTFNIIKKLYIEEHLEKMNFKMITKQLLYIVVFVLQKCKSKLIFLELLFVIYAKLAKILENNVSLDIRNMKKLQKKLNVIVLNLILIFYQRF